MIGGQLRLPMPHRGQAATHDSRDDWHTPVEFVEGLKRRWRFLLDVAAQGPNVSPFWLDHKADGLITPWVPDYPFRSSPNNAVWCNPPYGRRGELARAFVERAIEQAAGPCRDAGLSVVALMAATTDTRWFHQALKTTSEIWFTAGRLAFEHPAKGQANNNPTGSVLLVWDPAGPPSCGPTLGTILRTGEPPGGWMTTAEGWP